MQASYSTGTSVKIHQAIRIEWASFQAWLAEERLRLKQREHHVLLVSQRKRGKARLGEKEELAALHQEFVEKARKEWLARVARSELHMEHWVMTPDEKAVVKQSLGWTQSEMMEAYGREVGSKYQRVNPNTLGMKEAREKVSEDTRGFAARTTESAAPAYANWAAELSKAAGPSGVQTTPHTIPRSLKSVEPPRMPLYFVGAILQGGDLDAVAASHLESLALQKSEEKIREYYVEACEAAIRFQRTLATINPSQREASQDEFERRMQDLARKKEREWKDMIVKEVRKQQAMELEKRAAELRARRPPSRPAKTETRPRESDWDYVEEYPNPRSHRPSAAPGAEAALTQQRLEEYWKRQHQMLGEAQWQTSSSPQPQPQSQQPRRKQYANTGGPRWLRLFAHYPIRSTGIGPQTRHLEHSGALDHAPKAIGDDIVIRLERGWPENNANIDIQKRTPRKLQKRRTNESTTSAPAAPGTVPSPEGGRERERERERELRRRVSDARPAADQTTAQETRTEVPASRLTETEASPNRSRPAAERMSVKADAPVDTPSAKSHLQENPSHGKDPKKEKVASRRARQMPRPPPRSKFPMHSSRFYEGFSSRATSIAV